MSSIDGASFIVTTRFITSLISRLFQNWTQDKYTFGRRYWFAGTLTNPTTLLVMTNTWLKTLDRSSIGCPFSSRRLWGCGSHRVHAVMRGSLAPGGRPDGGAIIISLNRNATGTEP